MMFISSCVVVCVLLAGVDAIYVRPRNQRLPLVTAEVRLIEFGENNRTWLSVNAVHELARSSPPVSFIDVTEYDENVRSWPKMEAVALNAQPMAVGTLASMQAALDDVSPDAIHATIEHLSSYPTRYYTSQTGVEAAEWLRDQYDNILKDTGRVGASELFPHSWAQPSVWTTVCDEDNGCDRSLPVVVLGAHIDSTSSPSIPAPGADDDASGTATILEAFRVLMNDANFKPTRPIMFQGYAAEEVGLRGSQAIVDQMRRDNTQVLGMMQNDMTGFENGAPAVVTDFVSAELTELVLELTEKATPDTQWVKSRCGYGCSDHASFTRGGYAASFPFEAEFRKTNKAIHTRGDTLDKLTMTHAAKFSKLAVAFAYALGTAPAQ